MVEHNRHAILFRAEAQKAAAQVNVDQHVRRALLRKTAHMRVQDIAHGAKCAVWRSQLRGKGPKKKGGYVIGRLVTFDGCAWVQLGTQTVKVDRNQLRPAYGFESWAPGADDIQALKDAEKNLLHGNVQSLEGLPPPEDEPIEPEVLIPLTPRTPALAAPSTPAAPSTSAAPHDLLQQPASPRARQTKRQPKEAPSPTSGGKRSITEEGWEDGKISNLVCQYDDIGLTHEIEDLNGNQATQSGWSTFPRFLPPNTQLLHFRATKKKLSRIPTPHGRSATLIKRPWSTPRS